METHRVEIDKIAPLLKTLRRLEDDGQYEKAIFLLNRLETDWHKRPDVLRRRAYLLFHLGRYDAAIACLRKAGEDSKSTKLLSRCIDEQALFLEGIGCHAEAAKTRSILLRRDLGNIQQMIKIGISLAMAEQNEPALAYFDRALAQDLQNEEAWYNKGVTLMQMRFFDKALDCFEKAIQINRSNAWTWYQKALCLREKSRSLPAWKQGISVDEIRLCLGKAIRIDPRLEEAKAILKELQGAGE
ncbi:MAG: tetratricopeptide repeat protein [Phycisphaerales bacterium]|nr:MAG: tetratricopeptide repeat protein [Phycisphaerales bacterium]